MAFRSHHGVVLVELGMFLSPIQGLPAGGGEMSLLLKCHLADQCEISATNKQGKVSLKTRVGSSKQARLSNWPKMGFAMA